MANAGMQDSYRPLLLGFGRYVAAQVLVAISTLVALWIAGRWGSAAVEMVYLPAVLAAAIWWGFGPALLAAVTSALAYNFYFTEPLHTFCVDRAVDVVDVTILFRWSPANLRRPFVVRPGSPRPMRHGTPPLPASPAGYSPVRAKRRSPKAHASIQVRYSIATR